MILNHQSKYHRVFESDALELYENVRQSNHTLICDPPWESYEICKGMARSESVLAFCDGRRASDVVDIFGSPTWVFVWDCVSCWFTPNRPLKRMKMCFWYGDINEYNSAPTIYRSQQDKRRIIKNSRSEYMFEPASKKMLADCYSSPITKLHADGHRHAKPVEWIAALISSTSSPDRLIIDPFCGSGSSAVACNHLKRAWVGGDISGECVASTVAAISGDNEVDECEQYNIEFADEYQKNPPPHPVKWGH